MGESPLESPAISSSFLLSSRPNISEGWKRLLGLLAVSSLKAPSYNEGLAWALMVGLSRALKTGDHHIVLSTALQYHQIIFGMLIEAIIETSWGDVLQSTLL